MLQQQPLVGRILIQSVPFYLLILAVRKKINYNIFLWPRLRVFMPHGGHVGIWKNDTALSNAILFNTALELYDCFQIIFFHNRSNMQLCSYCSKNSMYSF